LQTQKKKIGRKVFAVEREIEREREGERERERACFRE